MHDDFDSSVADRFAVLEELPVPDFWARVELKALDHTPDQSTQEAATMIDLETPRQTNEHRNGSKRIVLAGLLAAAVVLIVGMLVVSDGDDSKIEVPAAPPSTLPSTTPVDNSSTELQVRPLDPPIDCEPDLCGSLAVSPDGTLVALNQAAETLTWYEEEPRVVPITLDTSHFTPDESGSECITKCSIDQDSRLVAIGPYDIAYIAVGWRPLAFIAVAPSGAEITRVNTPGGAPGLYATASGLTSTAPQSPPVVPWVDLDGNPITDTRPYPTANVTDAGIEVRLEEREWLLADTWLYGLVDFLPRSDGGVVMVFADAQAPTVLELSPDGAVYRYVVDGPPRVLPDGSLIVKQDSELVRLIPPA
jgi:hypothetical protein